MNDYTSPLQMLADLLRQQTGQKPVTSYPEEMSRLLNAQEWLKRNQSPRQGGATGMKGLGYFGAIPTGIPGQHMTELSANGGVGDSHYPLVVPTLSKEELQHILNGGKPTQDIYRKAADHAYSRGLGGKDPFATIWDARTVLP